MKSPTVMSIDEIGLNAHGHLFVCPLAASVDEFAYIWRDASGIRWNSELRALHAAEPARWVTAELYKQIISAVEREYGIRLQAIPSTRWTRIPDDLRTALTALNL